LLLVISFRQKVQICIAIFRQGVVPESIHTPSMEEVWIFSGTAHLKKRYGLLRLFFLVASLVFLS